MQQEDPFFVGWLPMPRRFARFLWPVAVLLVVGGGVVGWMLAAGQQSPGPGVWDDGTTTLEGVAYADPYAMVRVPAAEPGGAARTVLLVEEGKFGARPRVMPHDGLAVRVSGRMLSRGGRLMMELAPGDAGLSPTDMPEPERVALRRPPPVSLGRVELRGEIVDAKCYLGAMKPGAGRTHRGCAVLCLKGGVPPLFATPEGSLHLLADRTGGPLGQEVCALAGTTIAVSGELQAWDDLTVLKCSPSR